MSETEKQKRVEPLLNPFKYASKEEKKMYFYPFIRFLLREGLYDSVVNINSQCADFRKGFLPFNAKCMVDGYGHLIDTKWLTIYNSFQKNLIKQDYDKLGRIIKDTYRTKDIVFCYKDGIITHIYLTEGFWAKYFHPWYTFASSNRYIKKIYKKWGLNQTNHTVNNKRYTLLQILGYNEHDEELLNKNTKE